jgi:hypothetical protein
VLSSFPEFKAGALILTRNVADDRPLLAQWRDYAIGISTEIWVENFTSYAYRLATSRGHSAPYAVADAESQVHPASTPVTGASKKSLLMIEVLRLLADG